MRDPDKDDRSSAAKAYHWASRVITISVGMILPGLFGLWLDQKLGTLVLFALVGFSIGMTLGIYMLLRIAGSGER